MSFLLLYLICGAVTGIIAGLLGVGGGIVIVPMLSMLFTWQHFPPDQIQHMALGTSFGTIIFTSISSFIAHKRRGAVRWDIWKGVVLGILLGTFGGSWIASALSTVALKGFFACFLVVVGVRMLCNFTPKPGRDIPGKTGLFTVGLIIGVISSFAGIGGGTMSIPFMVWCNVPMQTAVGTSAAIGLPIALAGALGYMVNGFNVPDLPRWSLGFVYLPGLVALIAASVFTAPIGARMAHALPVARLKRCFGVFICLMALRMIWNFLKF